MWSSSVRVRVLATITPLTSPCGTTAAPTGITLTIARAPHTPQHRHHDHFGAQACAGRHVRALASSSTSSSSCPSPSPSPSPSSPSYTRLNFDSVSESFAVKSDAEIIRALLVFRACCTPFVVRHSRSLLELCDRVLGKQATRAILRYTFFGHFCGGENAAQLAPLIAKLESSGLRGMLNYAAESDVGPQHNTTTSSMSPAEAKCDANVQVGLSCISCASSTPSGFAQIKLSALAQPELLEQMSQILMESFTIFTTFVQQTNRTKPDTYQSAQLTGKITYDLFVAGLRGMKIELDEEQTKQLFARVDADQSGFIDYIEWSAFFDPLHSSSAPLSGFPTLSPTQRQQANAMISRLETLAEAAKSQQVKLMLDAEQTYFQPAIDYFILSLQRRYNKSFPIVFSTYQCYLKSTHARLVTDMERANREQFWLAAKCVRGAYMMQERQRAKEMGYPDPIQPTIQDTHNNYHLCVDTFLKQIHRCQVMVATHNETTVKWATKQMFEYGIADRGGGVYFGQLLGMCDHVSFSLGHVGYAVYKAVPYGPIHDVVPYLIRRAQENSSVLGAVGKERALLWNEWKRRIKLKFGITSK